LLTGAVAAYAVTVLLMKRSILTEKIARRGQHITREYAIDPFELARVRDVMVSRVDVLAADLSVAEAIGVIGRGVHRCYPVTDARGRPVGMVSRAEALQWAVEGGHFGETVGERVSDAAMPVAHPDDTAKRVVELMLSSGQGRIAVTDPATGVLAGLVSRKDLLEIRAQVARSEGERRAFFRPSGEGAV
jgi:CIC family chloride channel protein